MLLKVLPNIKIINKDSAQVAYDLDYFERYNRYKIKFDLKESERYKIEVLPGALTDFYGAVNDTLNFNASTKQKSDYGNMRVTIVNGKLPMIVQLVDDNDKVLYEKYAEEYPTVDFTDIDPKQYQIRVIFDENKNRKFDTGNYLKKIQPERISYSLPLEPVRANFDYNETITLND